MESTPITATVESSQGSLIIDENGIILDDVSTYEPDSYIASHKQYNIQDYMLFWDIQDFAKVESLDILEISGTNKDGTTFDVELSFMDEIMLPERHIIVKSRETHEIATDTNGNQLSYDNYSAYIEGIKKGLHPKDTHYPQNTLRS